MSKQDICQEITDKIIRVLDDLDLADYEAPFAGLAAQGWPCNPTTDHRYQGINVPSLWIDQQEKKFTSNQWATFRQWKEKGASVRKGEKGSPIIFYKTLTRTEENENGDEEESKIPLMRFYTVFNAAQVDGYEHHDGPAPNETDLVTRIESADRFCANTGADIRHGSGDAYYHRTGDFINMPATIAFVDTKHASATENYYATLLHELTHWTGAPSRLERDKAQSRKEIDKYAFEELIAELGAAFLCCQLAIVQTPRDDHALYIKSWLAALKDDKRFIFRASAQAAKAVDFLNASQDGGGAS